MAILHTSGTRLEPHAPKIPLNRPFLASLAVVFIIAMHFFMPNPGGSGLALSFNTTTWLALSVTLAIGLYQLATNRYLVYSKLTIGLFACCILMTVPALYSNSIASEVFGRLTGLWLGLLLFVLLQQFRFSNKHKQRLLWFIIIAVVIEALFGFYQYLYLDPNNIFGYDATRNRPYGIFQQPNVMASFLATGLVISGYLLARQTNKYSRNFEIVFLCLTPLLTAPLLIIIASRTGWLGAIIALIFVLPYLYKYASTKRFISWLICCSVGIGLGFFATNIQGTTGLLSNKVDLESPRRYTFPQTLDMVIEKPFTGYGYGKFESEYILYTARQHQLNPNYKPGLPAMDHPHNELLFWGVEGGLVPVLAIVLAASLVLARIYYAKKGTRLAMFALFVPIVLHSQLEYPFYHSAIHWVTFIILLYWVDQRVANYKQVRFTRVTKSLLRVACLVLPFVTTVYMVSALHTNYVLTQFERSSPKEPEILSRVTNPVVWKDRYDWDIYSTYLNLGLYQQDPELIRPYIDWSLSIIQAKPRPAFYSNLILAYQGLDDSSRAEQIRAEAQYLFPEKDFSMVQYQPKLAESSSLSAATGAQ
ncbi:PglL family O-oligosaccharyltransferase [Vibrio sp. ZSDE26]|uniref:PglL family O-oligosaccharyltransferase n=1 Tax=Vibrio amylolyticus TaxID=2847292 RepID=A0A9X2BFW7_9VIBR|nr:PglL family O-oligosaccharyltransferase [Vibrio amylolyticus]MCK6262251.1 PglL family O-oligosaccharyltransferase [Vibrio amylolyticus]